MKLVNCCAIAFVVLFGTLPNSALAVQGHSCSEAGCSHSHSPQDIELIPLLSPSQFNEREFGMQNPARRNRQSLSPCHSGFNSRGSSGYCPDRWRQDSFGEQMLNQLQILPEVDPRFSYRANPYSRNAYQRNSFQADPNARVNRDRNLYRAEFQSDSNPAQQMQRGFESGYRDRGAANSGRACQCDGHHDHRSGFNYYDQRGYESPDSDANMVPFLDFSPPGLGASSQSFRRQGNR